MIVGWTAAWLAVGVAHAQAPSADGVEVDAERAALQEERVRLAEQQAAFERQKAEWEATVQEQLEGLREPVTPEGDRTGFGRSVDVPVGEVWEEAISFGGDVRVHGHVTGDAVSFGGNVIVEDGGRVDQGAVSFGGAVQVQPGGVLQGDRVAMAVPSVANQFLPAPETTAENYGGSILVPSTGSQLWSQIQWRLVGLLAVAGAGVLTVGLFPGRVRRIARDLEVRPLRAALLGTLASVFVVVFSVLLAVITVGFGIPISLLLLCGLGLSWLLGFVGLCQAVGDRLPLDQRPYGRWLAFLIGVVPLAFLGSLPWIGWVVVGAASVIGIGGAVSTRLGSVTAAVD